VLCVVMCCWNTVSARPKEEEEEEDVSLAESKDPETKPLEDLLAELRDSTIIPVLLNPFQITKLTCGSLLTFYDTGATDATVSVDLCLTALIVAKLLLILPLIVGDWNIENLILAWETAREDTLYHAGTGQDQEPLVKSLDVSGAQDTFLDQGDINYNSQDEVEYFGFGPSGWKSGLGTSENFLDFANNSLSRRGFPAESLEKVMSSTLHDMEKAVTVANGTELSRSILPDFGVEKLFSFFVDPLDNMMTSSPLYKAYVKYLFT